MFRSSNLLRGILALALFGHARAQLPAFPGAEGFGSIASGGRGGDVYYVTNRNASGAGSFVNGIQTAPAGGRTIVFAVSGHIRLPSGSGGGLTIDKSRITIAGQTAPGDGICFWNNTMNITGDDLVFRNLRWRYGKQSAGGDSVDINGSERLIFDHCDVMFSTDENLSSFGTAPEHLTFQWSTNAWGLSGHSAGGLWKTKHASVHHTLWANNHTRNPKLIGCDVLDWTNNLVFGWDNGFNMAQEFAGGSGVAYRLNIRGSSFIHGGSTGSAIYGGGTNDDASNKFKLHMADTALDGNNNGILDVSKSNYALVSSGTTYDPVATPWPQTHAGDPVNPLVGVPVTVSPRLTAYKQILSKTGAVRMEIGGRPLRDEITSLCITRAANLQRGIIADPLDLGLSTGSAFADLQSAPAPFDGDLDGLPDDWEDALGLDKSVPGNNAVLGAPETAASFFPPGSPAGYTRLEEYLHFKAVPHGGIAKNTAASPSFIDIDLRKFTAGFTASPVFTLSNLVNGTTTQSGPGGAIVRFTPPLDASGRAGFHFTVTDATGSTWTQQCCLLVATKPQARPITWLGDGLSNHWDATTANFTSLVGPAVFAAGDAVTLDDSGSNSPALEVVGALAPASLTVSNPTKNFTLAGSGSLAATGRFTKSGGGTLTLSNSGPNSFSAAVLEAGTLSLATANALGGAPVSFTGGTLALSADQANALSINGSVAISPTGSRTMNGAWSGSGTIQLTNTGSNLLTLGGGMAGFSGELSLGASTGNIRLNGNTGSAATAFDLGSSTVTLHTRNGGATVHLGSLGGGAGTRLAGASSVAGTTTFSIGALGTSTVFAGTIANGSLGTTAPTALTKTGPGSLTLTGNSSHTGATQINSGTLALLGGFGSSPVAIAANAALTGTGTTGGSLAAAAGAVISPGADLGDSPGTLAAASLDLTSPTLRFDLSANPAAGNDRLQATGPVTLNGPQNFIFKLVDGILAPGTYQLVTTPGTLTANGVTLTSNLPTTSRQTLVLEHSPSGSSPGYVRLVVTGSNADLTWTGANGGLWDQQSTTAWSGASPAIFFDADGVTFDDSATSGSVTITQPVAPRSLTVNNSAARPYTLTGAPLTGTTSLVKSGGGTLTLNVPQYALANCGTTTGSPTLAVPATTGLLPGMTVIGPGIPAATTVVSVTNATTLTLSQNATATSSTASLVFETRNTFSGGTILNAGSLVLACNNWQYYSSSTPPPSNTFGLGSGPITLNGGTLTLLGHTGNAQHLYGALPNDLIVPAGKTATLRSTLRGTSFNDFAGLRGSLTGSGTLNLTVNFAYGAITGDWSAFSGTLNVTRPATNANDPRFQLGNELGLPLATVSLDQVQLEYSATPPAEGVTLPIGSLAGPAGSVISGAQSGSAPVTWRVGSLNTSTTFAGSFTPSASRPIGLAKTGSGTWTLTGSGTVSGGISVEQGTLSYGDDPADSLAGTSPIAVQSGSALQLNAGATLHGSALEIPAGATLRGRGSVHAESSIGGTVDIAGGTLALGGDCFLGGATLRFGTFTDRLAVTGDLALDATIELPASGLSFGRKTLLTHSGTLTLGPVAFAPLPAAYLPVLDTSVAGEVAVLLVDQAAYQVWRTANFGNTSDPAGAPLADPDQDGMTNLEEFEAATNPNNPASSIPLVWQGGGGNLWDLATTANWRENTTPRVFRDRRQVSITDTGSNSPAITLTGSLQPGSLVISNSTKAFTLSGSGSLDGSAGLAKSGGNTLTLATSNTYSGPTTISAGVVTLQDDLALGSTAAGTSVAANARLELQGGITVTGESLTLSGTGGASFFNGALNSKSGSNTWTGPLTLAASDTRIGAQAGATLSVAGPIASAPATSGLVVRPADATATVVLSGPNSYTGPTTVVGGSLRLGAADTLPSATTLRLGLSSVSGKLDLNGHSQRLAGFLPVSGSANEIGSASPATLTVDASTDSTCAAVLTGSLALAKSGPATLTLAAPSSATGPTRVLAGKLLVDLSALATPVDLIHPASALVLAGGTLEIKGKSAAASSQTFALPTLAPDTSSTIVLTPNGASSTTLTLGDSWTLGANASLLIDLSAPGCAVFSNPPLAGWLLPGVSVKDGTGLTGPATVVAGQVVRYVPSVLTVSSNDPNAEFSSLASAYPGGLLDWTDGGLLTHRAVHRLILDTTLAGGTIDLGAPSNLLTLSSGEIQFRGSNDLVLTGGRIGASGSAVSLATSGSNALTLASPVSGGAGSLAITGSAKVILSAANTFTGGLTLDGGTLKQGVANAFGSANGSLTLHSGSLDLNGIATGLGVLTGSGGSISSSTAATLTLGNNNASGGDFAGSIGGPVALAKTGTGTQILSGPNSYTGLTTVGGGSLRTGADHALGDGDLAINGGTLDLQSFSDSVAALTLVSGSITGTSGLLTATSYSLVSGSISARLGGASATLAKSGATYTHTATLSGANSYGGITTLGSNSGSLVLAHNSAVGNTASIEVEGNGSALVLADGVTITGKPVTLRGNGTNNGSSAGSFAGALTTAANATATWTGSVTLGDGNGRLGSGNSGSLHLSGPILGSGANQSLSLSSGSGANIGTVVLAGSNNFTGNISIVRGNLKLGAANTLPATAILDVGSANVTDSTGFDLAGFSQTLAGLRRSSANATQASTVTNSSATAATLTLNQSSNLSYSGRITGSLTLAKSGAGSLTLTRSDALAASVSLDLQAGTVSIAHPHAITALRLNGVWQAPGTYTAAHPSGRIGGAGSLVVATAGPSGFGAWIDGFNTLTAAEKLPDADPDADGVANLLEYVLNGLPTTADPSILPAPSLTPTHFVFSFTRREESAATTTQVFEYGSTLGAWTPVSITAPTGPGVSLGTLAGGIRTVTVSVPRSTAIDGRLFGRLKVTTP
jgi:autotransporter-associated beta strand protein